MRVPFLERATVQPSGGDDTDKPLEVQLQRKHEYESAGAKASHRTWDKLWCTLRGSHLCFYKDQKHAKESGGSAYYRNEQPLNLMSATCEVPSNYNKRPHVLRVSLITGAAYLLQFKNEDELTTWHRRLGEVTGAPITEPDSPAKSKTMPSTPPGGKKDDSSKKRGRFTLKKN